MAQKQVPAAGQPERLLAGLFEAMRNLTYASVGIVGAVGEEAEAAYRRSILRGRGRVQKVGRRLGLRTGAAAEPVTVEGEVASTAEGGLGRSAKRDQPAQPGGPVGYGRAPAPGCRA